MQAILIKNDDECICLIALPTENSICTFSKSSSKNVLTLNVKTMYGGANHIKCDAAIYACDKNPVNAIKKAYRIANDKGYILGGLRESKDYPKYFNYLGWCSWNCCYHDVTYDKIVSKAEEFKEKKIPVKWYVIDDGWANTSYCQIAGETYPEKIESFTANKEKFPNEIKSVCKTLKNEYGAMGVGIWHSFTGYWKGIAENSDAFIKNSDCIMKTPGGYYIPSSEKSYEFYRNLYKYFKDSSIDFLKVDTQGESVEYTKYMPEACQKTKGIYSGYNEAVNEFYKDNVINCMSHEFACQFFTANSSVIRSSDDFYPDKEESFAEHAMQNAYNSLFLSNLWYCDYDMWWSNHSTARCSGILRAISGGPVYLSDKIGDSCLEYILPLVDEEGRLYRCDDVGMVTADMIFEDPIKSEKTLKIFNRSNDDGVVALFNLSDKKITATVGIEDFGGKGEYAAYIWGKKRFSMDNAIEINLLPKQAEIINFYAVDDGCIEVGDLSKYISIADKNKKKVKLKDIL